VAGGAVHLDRLDLAVGLEPHGDLQRPVEPAPARLLRIVEVADALDLQAPVVHVHREAVLGGARADELLARALLVGLVVAPDLRLEALDLQALLDQLLRRAVGLLALVCHRLRGSHGRLRLQPRHELARLALELAHAALGALDLGRALAAFRHREGARGAALLVGVAAAVEVRLRQRVGLRRPRGRLRVHEHDVEDVVRGREPLGAGHLEAQADDGEGVQRHRGHERDLHGGDEPEPLQQVVGELQQRVGGRLPQLHRAARTGSGGRDMSGDDSSRYCAAGFPA